MFRVWVFCHLHGHAAAHGNTLASWRDNSGGGAKNLNQTAQTTMCNLDGVWGLGLRAA